MVEPLNDKGHDPKLVAALRRLVKRLEATPEPLRGPFVVKGLAPYLSALPAPDGELEVVAWELIEHRDDRSAHKRLFEEKHHAREAEYASIYECSLEPLVRQSEAASAIQTLTRERDEARTSRDAARDNFHTMQQAAYKLAEKLKAAEARAEAAEAQVRVLEQERDRARAALERIAAIKYPMVDTLYALKATIDYARDQARAVLSDGGRKDG